jgi:hypothetical protein
MEDFPEWERRFRGSRKGRQALEALARLDSPSGPERYPDFEFKCLAECHRAAAGAYDWREGAIATARRYQEDALEAREAAEVLARFLETHDAAGWALWLAGARVVERELEKGGRRGGGFGELLGFVYAAMQALPEAIERTSARDPNFGSGLDYGKAMLPQARTPNSFAVDALVFRLTYHCRNWTGIGHVRIVTSPGLTMPAHGRPCSAAVAGMVNATLGTDLSDASVRDMMKKRLAGARTR